MLPMKMIYSREKVRQSLHCNTIFHLLFSHHFEEKMQDSELLFMPADLNLISLSAHDTTLKLLWSFFRASGVRGISDGDCHVMQRLLLQCLPACHGTLVQTVSQGWVTSALLSFGNTQNSLEH